MSSRTVSFPLNEDEGIGIPMRSQDDLPQHVKGRAYWVAHHDNPNKNSYGVEDLKGKEWAIEFLNNDWYVVRWRNNRYESCRKAKINRYDFGLGWWEKTDPAHPDYEPPVLDPHSPRGIEVEESEGDREEKFRDPGSADESPLEEKGKEPERIDSPMPGEWEPAKDVDDRILSRTVETMVDLGRDWDLPEPDPGLGLVRHRGFALRR